MAKKYPSESYFKERQKQLWKNLEKEEDKLVKLLKDEYDKQARILENEIAQYYARFGKDDVIEYRHLLMQLDKADRKLMLESIEDFIVKYPEHAHLLPVRESVYKLDRLEALSTSIKMQQIELGVFEEKALEEHLIKVYGDGYKKIAESMGFGKNFGVFDHEAAKLLVHSKWVDDKDFSERIWGNRDKVTDFLNNEFKHGIIRGDNYAKLVKTMKMKFVDKSTSNIKALIFTEGTFVNNAAMMQPFEDAEIFDEYEYVSVIDDRTSQICTSLNGQKFKLKNKQAGLNFPPMHVRCRSSFSIVMPSDYIERYKKRQLELLKKEAEEKA